MASVARERGPRPSAPEMLAPQKLALALRSHDDARSEANNKGNGRAIRVRRTRTRGAVLQRVGDNRVSVRIQNTFERMVITVYPELLLLQKQRAALCEPAAINTGNELLDRLTRG